MRVRKNGVYTYNPVPLDVIDAKGSIEKGAKVRVIALPGCPPPNTMNHCHVETLDGEFLGLVHCNSLEK